MSGVEAYPILSYWHSTKPIYSCDFNLAERKSNKFLTCGGDSRIKIWKFKDIQELNEINETSSNVDDITSSIKTHFRKAKDRINDIEYITTLNGFSKPVNTAKFSPCGKYIAGCGDDGYIIIWEEIDEQSLEKYKKELAEKYAQLPQEQQFFIQNQLKNDISKIINPYNFPVNFAENFNDEYEDEYSNINDIKQLYRIIKYFPVTNLSANEQLEIYSLDWSPDSQYLVIGYMNTYIKIIDINESQQPYCVVKKNHNDVVQGCVWDPLNELIISMGADRAICIYKPKYTNSKLTDLKLVNRIVKGELDTSGKQENIFAQVDFNFFRKLQFSPDGSLLVLPYGIYKNTNGEELNCCHIFHRANLLRGLNKPIAIIPNLKKRCLCVSFNPNLYKNDSSLERSVLGLEYKMIFAIATDDEIMIYDTNKLECLMIIKNLHYYPIYSMSWNSEGNKIIISSKDGFLSTIDFKTYRFGDIYIRKIENEPMDIVNEDKKISTEEVKVTNLSQPSIINVLQIRKKQ